ncbi:MAG: hypothetical protein QOC82_1548 [Frankiaceae bacterium]|nr:hypothetical protein [Frankiaceae bacterium]
MAVSYPILQTVRDLFPKSGRRTVMIENAWRPYDGHTEPGPGNWNPGWSPVNQPATYAVLKQLKDDGYTWANVVAGARHRRDVPISRLI